MNRDNWIDLALLITFFLGMLLIVLTIFDVWPRIFP